jgi:hypothetical protein
MIISFGERERARTSHPPKIKLDPYRLVIGLSQMTSWSFTKYRMLDELKVCLYMTIFYPPKVGQIKVRGVI